MLVNWVPPRENQVALNVDGRSPGNSHTGMSGHGGLIRDHTGSWIIGFSGYIGLADSVEAELEGIRIGLMLAWELGYRDVSCRSDSKIAIYLIQDSTSHEYVAITEIIKELMSRDRIVEIRDNIKELMSRDWIVSLVHTYREANQCADFMAKIGAHTYQNADFIAKMGGNTVEGLTMFPKPLSDLSSLLSSDAKRTPYVRV